MLNVGLWKDYLPDKFFQKDNITTATKKDNAHSYCRLHLEGEITGTQNRTFLATQSDCLLRTVSAETIDPEAEPRQRKCKMAEFYKRKS